MHFFVNDGLHRDEIEIFSYFIFSLFFVSTAHSLNKHEICSCNNFFLCLLHGILILLLRKGRCDKVLQFDMFFSDLWDEMFYLIIRETESTRVRECSVKEICLVFTGLMREGNERKGKRRNIIRSTIEVKIVPIKLQRRERWFILHKVRKTRFVRYVCCWLFTSLSRAVSMFLFVCFCLSEYLLSIRSLCLRFWLRLYTSLILSIWLYLSAYESMFVCLSVCLSVFPLSLSISVCLSVCLWVFLLSPSLSSWVSFSLSLSLWMSACTNLCFFLLVCVSLVCISHLCVCL